jgi:phosphoglycerol transferase
MENKTRNMEFPLRPSEQKWLSRPLLIATVIIGIITAWLVLRSFGYQPVVMSDEQRFSTYSRLLPLSDASVPSYLFYFIYGITNQCGQAFLDCGRLLNVFFLCLSSVPIYAISRCWLTKKVSAYIVVLSLMAPAGYYTIYYMPEMLYYCAFWMTAWTILREGRQPSTLAGACISGIAIGLLSLIKPHAFFLLPAYFIFKSFLYISYRSKISFLRALTHLAGALFTMVAVRFGLGYIFAGPAGADLIGSMYGTALNKSTQDVPFHTTLAILHVLKGHLLGILILFAMPIAASSMAISNSGITNSYDVRKVMLLVACILLTMLLVTAAYTVQVNGITRYESIERMHMRYYFFLFPFFTIFAAIYAGNDGLRPKNWQKILVVCLIGVTLYAGFVGLKGYAPSPIDSPDLWAISTTRISLILFASLQTFSLIIFLIRPASSSKFFIYIFLPLALVVTAIQFPGFLNHYRAPSPADQAGMMFDLTIGSEVPVAVIGDDDSDATRTIFHLNNKDIEKYLIPTNALISYTFLPKRIQWIINLGENPFSPDINGQMFFSAPGYSIWHVSTGNWDIDFSAPVWPGVKEIQGVSHAESFGRWSDQKQVVINFTVAIPSDVKLKLIAGAFAKNVDQPFDIKIGNQHQIFKIKQDVSVFTTDFKNIEPGTHEIIITVPDAISPKDLGMSGDPRKLGASLVHLSLEPIGSN